MRSSETENKRARHLGSTSHSFRSYVSISQCSGESSSLRSREGLIVSSRHVCAYIEGTSQAYMLSPWQGKILSSFLPGSPSRRVGTRSGAPRRLHTGPGRARGTKAELSARKGDHALSIRSLFAAMSGTRWTHRTAGVARTARRTSLPTISPRTLEPCAGRRARPSTRILRERLHRDEDPALSRSTPAPCSLLPETDAATTTWIRFASRTGVCPWSKNTNTSPHSRGDKLLRGSPGTSHSTRSPQRRGNGVPALGHDGPPRPHRTTPPPKQLAAPSSAPGLPPPPPPPQ